MAPGITLILPIALKIGKRAGGLIREHIKARRAGRKPKKIEMDVSELSTLMTMATGSAFNPETGEFDPKALSDKVAENIENDRLTKALGLHEVERSKLDPLFDIMIDRLMVRLTK